MGNVMTEFNGPSSLEQMGAVGQVVTYVRQAIQAGKYSVGDKLPNEAELAKLAGIDPADCVAVGDGDNDVAMLKAAGLGIAMGSGSAAAKAAADRIGPDAEPHGIAELCRALWPEAF